MDIGDLLARVASRVNLVQMVPLCQVNDIARCREYLDVVIKMLQTRAHDSGIVGVFETTERRRRRARVR